MGGTVSPTKDMSTPEASEPTNCEFISKRGLCRCNYGSQDEMTPAGFEVGLKSSDSYKRQKRRRRREETR